MSSFLLLSSACLAINYNDHLHWSSYIKEFNIITWKDFIFIGNMRLLILHFGFYFIKVLSLCKIPWGAGFMSRRDLMIMFIGCVFQKQRCRHGFLVNSIYQCWKVCIFIHYSQYFYFHSCWAKCISSRHISLLFCYVSYLKKTK